MEETFLKVFVWTDYRLAVLFGFLIPLALSIWALLEKIPSIQRLLLIYWRVASLWVISIYLLIPIWQLGYLTWSIANILIPISLWFWVDVNDEIQDLPKSKFKLAVTSWRWAMTIYCALSFLAYLPFVSCAFSPDASLEISCRVWLEAPWRFKEWFHPNARPGFLGFLGMAGLIVYAIYFFYFCLFRFPKQGRIALEQ